jgi:hypothetical protein
VNTLERRLGVAATALIFAVAGSTSYYHLGELALAVGLPALLAWTLPSTVDTLMLVALVNLNRPGASRWNWLALGVGLLVSCAGNIFAVTDLVPIDTLRVAVAACPPLCLAILKLATRSAKPAAPVAAPVVSGEVRDSTPLLSPSPEASEPVAAPVLLPEPEPVPVPVLTLEPAPEPVSGPVVVVAAVEPSVALPVAPTDAVAARRVQVRELHAAGWSNAEMATELGCSAKTIGRDLADLGLEANRPSPSTNGAHPEPVGAS